MKLYITLRQTKKIEKQGGSSLPPGKVTKGSPIQNPTRSTIYFSSVSRDNKSNRSPSGTKAIHDKLD